MISELDKENKNGDIESFENIDAFMKDLKA
jgi:hypothetical protein